MERGFNIGNSFLEEAGEHGVEVSLNSVVLGIYENGAINVMIGDRIEQVKAQIAADDRVMVLLDSCHHKAHVAAELGHYAPLVSLGSYAVVMDGIMHQLVGAPRTKPDWAWNNPMQAALEFAEANDDFVIERPAFAFNEGHITEPITYYPNGYLKRIR